MTECLDGMATLEKDGKQQTDRQQPWCNQECHNMMGGGLGVRL